MTIGLAVRAKSGTTLLFGLTTFLAALLLFSAEPMIGKKVLPRFGGTPAVWNTCLVYYQLILLFGYAVSGNPVGDAAREDRFVSPYFLVPFALLLAAGCMQTSLTAQIGELPPGELTEPVRRLLRLLAETTAIPLLMSAATAPLVQAWFAITGHPRARDPYFLYAASNAGSLLGLLAYPFVIEPNLTLEMQGRLWHVGFVLLAILLLSCALGSRALWRRRREPGAAMSRGAGTSPTIGGDDLAPSLRPTFATRVHWLVLVFVPSSWLLGVTTYLTTDIASMPLLWVIPLALYLLSFIVAFAGPDSRPVRLAGKALPFLVMPLVLVMSAGFAYAWCIPIHLLTFFVGSLACHGELARRRPSPRDLSAFYVTIALGGLLGGIFNAIAAPLIFDRVVEYPIAIVLACLVASSRPVGWKSGRRRGWLVDVVPPLVIFILTALLVTNQAGLSDSVLGVLGVMIASGLGLHAGLTAGRRPARFAMAAGAVLAASGLTQGPGGRLLHVERSFFGVLRVTEDPERKVHRLFHGSTLHGQQGTDPGSSREPSTYFARSGPIGQVFGALGTRLERPGTRVAIVGLGAGTLAAYASPGQRWSFYEIDPAVERIARDPHYFTYLRDCEADSLEVVLGDARLRLREAPTHAFRLIVLDAFSSDSLPVHLVTREAIRLYRDRLEDGGVLAFNLSNRYLDLDPVIGRQAEDAGLVCRIRRDTAVSIAEREAGKQPSIWAVMAATDANLGALASDARWQPPRIPREARAWTDDYSDLTSYLHWLPRLPWTRRAKSPTPAPNGPGTTP